MSGTLCRTCIRRSRGAARHAGHALSRRRGESQRDAAGPESARFAASHAGVPKGLVRANTGLDGAGRKLSELNSARIIVKLGFQEPGYPEIAARHDSSVGGLEAAGLRSGFRLGSAEASRPGNCRTTHAAAGPTQRAVPTLVA